MCIGVALQVIECHEQTAIAAAGGRRERLNLALAALAALDAALSGTQDLDTYFADLATREPQLPPHLRKPPKETSE